MASADCLSNATEIAAGSGAEEPTPIFDFLRYKSEPGNQSQYSLLVFPENERWRSRARLHVTEEISSLPMIMRNGVSAPWMAGAPIGSRRERVTDPEIQRSGSLHVSNRATAEDWLRILCKLNQIYKRSKSQQQQLLVQNIEDAERPPYNIGRPSMDLVKGFVQSDKPTDQYNAFAELLRRRFTGGYINVTLQVERSSFEKFIEADAKAEKSFPDPVDDFADLLSLLMRAVANTRASAEEKRKHLSWFYGGEHPWFDFYEVEDHGDPKNRRYLPIERRNLVIQGAGDLSMNPKNVAFLGGEREHRMIVPLGETLIDRSHTCLLGFKRSSDEVREKVEAMKFDGAIVGGVAIAAVKLLPGRPFVRLDTGDDLSDSLEFALYGKRIIWDGRVLNHDAVIDDFQDLRHVFKLANINPKRDGHQKWMESKDEAGKPRFERFWQNHEIDRRYASPLKTSNSDEFGVTEAIKSLLDQSANAQTFFGDRQESDVWLLEKALLSDRNLRLLACLGPISVPLAELGALRLWIEWCLFNHGYRRCPRLDDVRDCGQFCWDDSGLPQLRIRLHWNAYPCTMVGIGELPKYSGDGKKTKALYFLAWGHQYSQVTPTLWECAKALESAGARYALVIDEGTDVFQCHIPDADQAKKFEKADANFGSLDDWMPIHLALDDSPFKFIKRPALRASIAVWQDQIDAKGT